MAISTKYGRIEIPGIGEGEPVFVLRAQDQLAAYAIGMYDALARSHGALVTKDLQREIEAFLNWSGTRKIPD